MDGGSRIIRPGDHPDVVALRWALEKKRRLECRRSFLAWCIEALRPFGQSPAAHHRLLIAELQAVADGLCDRLMIFMPPGSAKSRYATVLFSAWLLSRRRDMKLIGASHTSELADDFSGKVQDFITENAPTLGYELASKAVGRWYTTNGGAYLAAGVRAGIPGFRADCLAGNTKVNTISGLTSISEVKVGTETGYVLSYDERNKRPVFSRVLAVARRSADALWRIRTVSGRVVEATGNHRFWTGGGWKQAASLSVGDVFLCSVRRSAPTDGGGNAEGVGPVCDGPALQQCLLHSGEQRFAGIARAKEMHRVRQGYSVETGVGPVQSLLFGILSEHSCQKCGFISEALRAARAATMRVLQLSVRAQDAISKRGILQSSMQGSRTRLPDGRRGKSRLAQRREPPPSTAAFGARLPQDEAGHPGTGRLQVCGVLGNGEVASPPHQHELGGQSLVESGNALLGLSRTTARRGEVETEADTVAVVERICQSTEVFDIQVEGTECFFADGILVHNCAIIDDPVKGRQAADSPTDRKQVWDWYNGDLERRLTPNASIVLMQTRWHEDDLSGRLLAAEPHRWRVLRLPAEAEEDDPLGRKPGEWLWSDDAYGFGQGLAQIKQSLSERAASREWTAQYQQRPVPDTGDYFKREWLRPVPALPPRSSLRVFGASDYAVTAEGGDFTVHIVVGVDSDDRLYVLDMWRGQTASDEWVEQFCNLVIRWKPMGWAEEGGQIRAGIGPFLDKRSRERRAFVARQMFPTGGGDKGHRAQSIRGRMALNGLYVAADWPLRADFEAELLSFPAGKFDDIPDALGLIGMLLDVMMPPPGPKPPAPPKDSWDRAFRGNRDEDGDGWKVA